eukprot:5778725-Prymnesium_polylepis.2
MRQAARRVGRPSLPCAHKTHQAIRTDSAGPTNLTAAHHTGRRERGGDGGGGGGAAWHGQRLAEPPQVSLLPLQTNKARQPAAVQTCANEVLPTQPNWLVAPFRHVWPALVCLVSASVHSSASGGAGGSFGGWSSITHVGMCGEDFARSRSFCRDERRTVSPRSRAPRIVASRVCGECRVPVVSEWCGRDANISLRAVATRRELSWRARSAERDRHRPFLGDGHVLLYSYTVRGLWPTVRRKAISSATRALRCL